MKWPVEDLMSIAHKVLFGLVEGAVFEKYFTTTAGKLFCRNNHLLIYYKFRNENFLLTELETK